MIISEKQIMHLIYFTTEYKNSLFLHNKKNNLTEEGANQLLQVTELLERLYNQQSEQLKEIK